MSDTPQPPNARPDHALIERQRRHFDSIAADYAHQRSHPNHRLVKQLIWTHFLSRHRHNGIRCQRVLEPMCGLGEGHDILLEHLCPGGFDYHGFDWSAAMVDAAHAQRAQLDIVHGDASRFEADGRFWDFIVLIGGLHHVYAHSADVLARLTSALSHGGYFLSFEPTQACGLTRWIRQRIYRRNAVFDAESEQGFDLDQLELMFAQQAYRKVDQVHVGLSAYVLYYNPDAFPWLNRGGPWTVRAAFWLDRLIWRSALGRRLSFATITLWQKN
jgi:SAM-dependent methyltransferase